MALTDILSQERAKNILQGIIDTQRIANAYLFVGPPKCGKTTAVKELVKTINGQSAQQQSL